MDQEFRIQESRFGGKKLRMADLQALCVLCVFAVNKLELEERSQYVVENKGSVWTNFRD
jgi:hypothetical protein